MFYDLLAKPRMPPKAIESMAAARTRYSGGRRKVIVWAGIQKKGMVLQTTKLMNSFHLIVAKTSFRDMSRILRSEPPDMSIKASVIL